MKTLAHILPIICFIALLLGHVGIVKAQNKDNLSENYSSQTFSLSDFEKDPKAAAHPKEDQGTPDWLKFKGYISTDEDLTLQHRTTKEVSDWLTSIISETLNLNPDNFYERLEKYSVVFSDQGWNQFSGFVKSLEIHDAVLNRYYGVFGLTESEPLLTRNGSFGGGAYKWIFEVPIQVSYFPYAEGLNPDPIKSINGTTKLTVEIIRISGPADGNGMVINVWNAPVGDNFFN